MRTALVTGASRGLGAAIAAELARGDIRVAINYHTNKAAADRVCQEIRAAGGHVRTFQADVRDEIQVGQMVHEIETHLGPIDILVPNATGDQPFLAIEDQTWQSYLDQLEFFVKSPLLLLKQVLPGMKARRWGRVIHIGSEVVELGNPRFANYVAAKAAQLGLMRSWATELAPFGITVNLIAPGWIPTERHTTATAAEMAAYTAGVPMRHMGVPDDVGLAVAFLASEGSGFMTGQKIAVNGGNTLG
ncbi:MAG: SDR family oxidoreductase [Acidobacteriaceae bacterium]